MVQWPAGIREQNALRRNPCHLIDVLPTLLELAGGTTAGGAVPGGAPPLAGHSLAPAFQRDGAVQHEFLYFSHNSNRALRIGDWKLISTSAGSPAGAAWRDWELYDLGGDRCELVNHAGRQRERVAQMAARWAEIDESHTRQRESAPPTAKRLVSPRGPSRTSPKS